MSEKPTIHSITLDIDTIDGLLELYLGIMETVTDQLIDTLETDLTIKEGSGHEKAELYYQRKDRHTALNLARVLSCYLTKCREPRQDLKEQADHLYNLLTAETK